MELHRDQRYHIAWILSSLDHHMIATHFFDEIFHRYTSTSSEIVYTLGRVGLHNVIAASIAHDPTPQSPIGDIVDSLLQEVPSIRAGFLVSADATVPRKETVRVGDVVVGLGSDMQAGVVYFDHQETTKQKRLFMTRESQRLPGAVLTAINDLRSHNGRNDWLRRLKQDGPTRISPPTACTGENGELEDIQLWGPEEIGKTQGPPGKSTLNYQSRRGSASQHQPKAFRGVVASSEQGLKDPALMERIGAGNGILCFETAAANMTRPFMVVSGIASCSGDKQQELPSNEVCEVVASYVACLVHLINPTKLAAEFPIASYFEYEAFDLDRPGFRLLRLEAGIGPIRCHVFQAYLDDEQSLIPYEALSYCWGSNRLAGTVIANEKVLFITENLSEALQHLRHRDEDRILWIDAICIDQNNIRERGHQVGCMGRIYSRADRVLIWLGYVSYELSPLISALNEFETNVPPGAWRYWSYDDTRWTDVWEKGQTDLLRRDERDGVNQQSRLKLLMSKPWFGRVWILQEVAKAKKASIGCSEGWISARSFALAPRLLGVAPDFLCQAIIDIMPGPSRRSSWWTQKQNLCTLLWRFRGSQANDPRDRLYALLDLASDTKLKEKITADYTKNEKAVVKDILAYLFNDDQSSNCFNVRDIADLQRNIPNLSCMALERRILCGAQIEHIQEFLQLQNKTVWLSEAAASYVWFVDTRLMDYLLNEPSFEYVALGTVSEAVAFEKYITVESFLNRREKKVHITRQIIRTARQNGIDPLALVVEESRDDIEITEALVKEAARNRPDTLKLLLDRRGNEVQITEELVEVAAQNGPNTLKLLLDRRGDEVKITEALVEDVARNGPDTLKLLLDRRGDEVKITEALVEVAARNGLDILKLLLDRRGNEVKITEALVEVAARNGPDTLKLLLDRRGDEVQITEELVKVAAWNGLDTLKLLLDRRGDEVQITEELVEVAARNGPDTVKLLLDRRGNEVQITEELVKVAAWNGLDTLKLLLDRRGNEVKITEALVKVAARNGPDTLKLLLDRRGNEVQITEELVEVAARNGPDTLKLLLDRR
ncbi:heterokaryon incompatibility protein-domain-containing protein [Dactylonectria macrodidyma]|uniref:Heterokaryon incompatibility protein-domain-containing protein n=1 Tax=Dactylonectria macrodidyma TaxID=307937 RepID=A0A9P9JIV1_9HYPO|nr:heterokaryon incompatibility protein-domain-containing protein [Dactylonectria macrodidyma]